VLPDPGEAEITAALRRALGWRARRDPGGGAVTLAEAP
jgi:hypothetical protein